MITSHAKWPRSRLEASLKSASAQKRMVEKYCHRARPITARRTREIYLKRPQTLAIFQIGVGTAFSVSPMSELARASATPPRQRWPM